MGVFFMANAQENDQAQGTFQGTVTDTMGTLLPGATVTMRDIDSQEAFVGFTDGVGKFSVLVPSGVTK